MKRNRKRSICRIVDKRRFTECLEAIIGLIFLAILLASEATSSSDCGPATVDAAGVGLDTEEKTAYIPQLYTETEVEMLSKTVYGEALVTNSKTEMSAVVWCVLNRVDADGYACGGSVEYVITFPGQFSGYSESNPVMPEIDSLVRDVLNRWSREKSGAVNVGRTLPSDYLFFVGDGYTNYYTKEWNGSKYWDWSLVSPYEN